MIMEENEDRKTGLEDTWGQGGAASIVSGMFASPFCEQYLALSEDAAGNAQTLCDLLKSLYEHQMYKELLLLLKTLCDLIGITYPDELEKALAEPRRYLTLLRELLLDFDDILTEEIA